VTDFIFVDRLPFEGPGGCYAHYDHVSTDLAGWQQCDVRQVIAANQDRWLDDFDDWHSVLCGRGEVRSAWWWCTRASRPNLWAQAAVLKPLFFAAALRRWCDAHREAGSVHVVGCPSEVRCYLQEFEGATLPAPRPRSGRPGRARALLAGIKTLGAQLIPLVMAHLPQRPAIPTGRVLFYSHVVQVRALQDVGDHYFGTMIDAAQARMPGAVLVTYLLDGDAELAEARRALQAGRHPAFFLFDHVKLSDVLWVLATCVRNWVALAGVQNDVPPVQLDGYRSRLFAEAYVASEVLRQPPTVELAVYRVLRRLLASSGVHTVIYPYEEKGIDRALLRACAEVPTPVRTLAYAHPAHTKAHLALRLRPDGAPRPPQPDRVLTAGRLEREFMVGWGRKPATRVVAIGSHRYRGPMTRQRNHADRRRALQVLMLTGHGFELSILANLIQRRPDLFAHDDVVIRRNSAGWFEAQERGIRRLSGLSDRIKVRAGTLLEQLEWCDVALFSSTTAGVEAMLAGRLAIYVALHDVFEADPLLGHAGCFARCATAEELAEALVRARALDDEGYDQAVRVQREFATSILGPLDEASLIGELQPSSAAEPDSRPRRRLVTS